jgi:hypothetical protein
LIRHRDCLRHCGQSLADLSLKGGEALSQPVKLLISFGLSVSQLLELLIQALMPYFSRFFVSNLRVSQ